MASAIGAVLLGAFTWLEYRSLTKAIALSQDQTVTGIVSQLTAGGADGRPRERFVVGESQFVYGATDITSAFHKIVGFGGPIRDGLPVRVTTVDGKIVRLELGVSPGNKR